MTIEQIKKHKEIIKWFCDNLTKGVWRKDCYTNNWHFCRQPEFNDKDTYVQNDEYAELRKALVDGKTVEYYEKNSYNKWFDITTKNRLQLTDFSIDTLRIKPDEPKFKIGDWVKIKQNGRLTQLKSKEYCKPNAIYDKISDNYFLIEDVELWKPKENELCVFWNNDNNDEYIIRRIKNFNLIQDEFCIKWDNIAPLEFIETLKS